MSGRDPAAPIPDFTTGPRQPGTQTAENDAPLDDGAGEADAPMTPPRWCHVAGCGRSATPHLWDAETCPIPPGVGNGEQPPA